MGWRFLDVKGPVEHNEDVGYFSLKLEAVWGYKYRSKRSKLFSKISLGIGAPKKHWDELREFE